VATIITAAWDDRAVHRSAAGNNNFFMMFIVWLCMVLLASKVEA